MFIRHDYGLIPRAHCESNEKSVEIIQFNSSEIRFLQHFHNKLDEIQTTFIHVLIIYKSMKI